MTLDELGAYLEAEGHGTESGSAPTILHGALPANPDNVIVLKELPGWRPGRVMGGVSYTDVRVQALVRDVSAATARTRAEALLVQLDGKADLTLSGTRYLFIEAMHEVADAGEDEKHRKIYSLTFRIKKERS